MVLCHRSRLAARVYVAVVLAGVGLGAAACGPSFQAVYECDVRFEHCYALDETRVTTDAKKACWREWLHGYTFGESRDRIDYAAERYSELTLGSTLPSIEAPGAHPRRASAGPIPTSAFAPPPNVAERPPSTSATPAAPSPLAAPVAIARPRAHGAGDRPIEPVREVTADAALRAPGQSCSTGCLQRWNACRDRCAGHGPCGEGCDRMYRRCVPACFR